MRCEDFCTASVAVSDRRLVVHPFYERAVVLCGLHSWKPISSMSFELNDGIIDVLWFEDDSRFSFVSFDLEKVDALLLMNSGCIRIKGKLIAKGGHTAVDIYSDEIHDGLADEIVLFVGRAKETLWRR